jgi:hypothetical protein
MARDNGVRSDSEITETEGDVSYRRIIIWGLVGVGVVVGVIAYFKYARLLAPLLG